MWVSFKGGLSLISSSGAEIQLGSVCEQTLPRPRKDCEKQQAGGSDPGPYTWLERGHGSRRRLLWRSRRVQHRLVRSCLTWKGLSGFSVLSHLCALLFMFFRTEGCHVNLLSLNYAVWSYLSVLIKHQARFSPRQRFSGQWRLLCRRVSSW